LKSGDEVITTPFSGTHTAEAVVRLGAMPIFADIERSTCNVNTDAIERLITGKTRAIIPASLFGQPAEMDEINAMAERRGLVVIEDGAHSFGATYKGKRSCNLSKIGCTGFDSKVQLSGEGGGGAIFTSDDS